MLLGAGASRACGLPDLKGLEQAVQAQLEPGDQQIVEKMLEDSDLESVLSRLRRIAVLLEGRNDTVDDLSAEAATALDRQICGLIVSSLDDAKADLEPMFHLAAWLSGADYHLPIELFTVNYDLLLERGLEELGVPYFDGFVGVLRARFRPDLVEADPRDTEDWLPAFLARVWKLHGSVHWARDANSSGEIVRTGSPVPGGEAAAIYPSDAKYDESRRVPFLVLQDRFRRALNHPETLTMISGYSFGDQHLNELIFDAARRRPRSETIAFCYGALPDTAVDRAKVTPNFQIVGPHDAVVGGVHSDWAEPDDLEDPDIWDDGFALGDFARLTTFLARTSRLPSDVNSRLRAALHSSAESPDE